MISFLLLQIKCSRQTEKNSRQTRPWERCEIYIFENKEHDFPQRIVYENQGKKEMLASIEGELNGKSRKSEFRYKRQ